MTSQRPVRFGVHTGPQHVGYQELVKLWQRADQLGFHWASVFDHFMPIAGADVEGPCLEGMVALTALATQTSRLRIGTLVLGVTYRHPAVLANMAATLDIVSGGRLELGLGAAWFQGEHEAYGITFPPPAERIRRLREALKVIKLLWTEHKANFDGRYYTLKDALCEPKPLQKPRPPLWVGGMGEQLTLRVVAEEADGWNAFMLPPDAFQHKLDILAQHCARVGRDSATVQKSMMVSLVLDENKDRAEERVRAVAQRQGFPLEQLRGRVMVGTPQEVIERLRTYNQMGVDLFILGMQAPYDYTTLELCAEKVMPAFR